MKPTNLPARLLVLALVALLFTGCVYRSYAEGGAHYTSWSFVTSQGVAPFSLEAGKAGDPSYRKIDSKGLTNSPDAEAMKAFAEGAVTAGIKAAAK